MAPSLTLGEVAGQGGRASGYDYIDAGDVLTWTFDTGLTTCDEYTFDVKAENGRGLSDASDPSTAVAAAEPPGPPAAVVGYPGDDSAMACWEPPEDDGCSPVTEYEVTVDSVVIGTTDGETTCLYIPDLVNGIESTIEVRARNAADWGTSEDGTVTPTAPELDRITFVSSRPAPSGLVAATTATHPKYGTPTSCGNTMRKGTSSAASTAALR